MSTIPTTIIATSHLWEGAFPGRARSRRWGTWTCSGWRAQKVAGISRRRSHRLVDGVRKVNLWARFPRWSACLSHLQNLIVPQQRNGDKKVPAHAGLFANLFDAHPPFQIDESERHQALPRDAAASDDWRATPTRVSPMSNWARAQLNLLPALPPTPPSLE